MEARAVELPPRVPPPRAGRSRTGTGRTRPAVGGRQRPERRRSTVPECGAASRDAASHRLLCRRALARRLPRVNGLGCRPRLPPDRRTPRRCSPVTTRWRRRRPAARGAPRRVRGDRPTLLRPPSTPHRRSRPVRGLPAMVRWRRARRRRSSRRPLPRARRRRPCLARRRRSTRPAAGCSARHRRDLRVDPSLPWPPRVPSRAPRPGPACDRAPAAPRGRRLSARPIRHAVPSSAFSEARVGVDFSWTDGATC